MKVSEIDTGIRRVERFSRRLKKAFYEFGKPNCGGLTRQEVKLLTTALRHGADAGRTSSEAIEASLSRKGH